MLVLTRKEGEKIRIGGDIEVVVLQIDRGRIKLGIRAPKSVSVDRHEVAERIKNETRKRPSAGRRVSAD